MQIDWTTFALEIVNFLALVWILKRFLYKPVLATLAERRTGIERTLAEARAAEARAGELKTRFEGRLADWEKEKAVARARLESDLGAERARQLEALGQTLADERARGAAQESHRKEELQRESENQALAQARAFTTRLLERLAGPQLEARLVALFIEEFAELTDAQLDGPRAALKAAGAQVAVGSAFTLPGQERSRIAAALAARLALADDIVFNEETELVCGVRLTIGPWQLGLSLGDELAWFAASSNHAD